MLERLGLVAMTTLAWLHPCGAEPFPFLSSQRVAAYADALAGRPFAGIRVADVRRSALRNVEVAVLDTFRNEERTIWAASIGSKWRLLPPRPFGLDGSEVFVSPVKQALR